MYYEVYLLLPKYVLLGLFRRQKGPEIPFPVVFLTDERPDMNENEGFLFLG
jgi:hypothetical protein